METTVEDMPVERPPLNPSAATFCPGEAGGLPVQGLGWPRDRTA